MNSSGKKEKTKILFAEDNPVTAKMLGFILERWNYEPILAKDGLEALQILEGESPPKLILMDWMMPKMDGIELCRHIRNKKTDSPSYIILLTSRGEKSDIVSGLEAGANDYMLKPFDNEELRVRLQVGRKMLELQDALLDKISELNLAIEQIKTLQGLIPICMYCKKIRSDKDYWEQIDSYIAAHSEVKFSHGICPDCYKKIVEPMLENKKGTIVREKS